MSAGDVIITIIIWLYKNAVSLLPTEIIVLPINTYTGYLDSFKVNFVYAFSGISKLISVELLFAVVLVVLTGEILLFGVKAGIFIINLIRGSGA